MRLIVSSRYVGNASPLSKIASITRHTHAYTREGRVLNDIHTNATDIPSWKNWPLLSVCTRPTSLSTVGFDLARSYRFRVVASYRVILSTVHNRLVSTPRIRVDNTESRVVESGRRALMEIGRKVPRD